MIESRVVRDAAEALVHVWGRAKNEESKIVLRPLELSGYPTHLRLTSVAHFVQGGSIRLFWEGENEHTLLMPLESRGSYVLDWCAQALADPKVEGWKGNVLVTVQTSNECWFTLVLEFAKQRG